MVPLPFDMAPEAFDRMLAKVNGALITGGETPLQSLASPYMRASSRLYEHSLARHAEGEVWPLWGTCMGMQVLSILGAGDPSVLLTRAYDSEGLMLPLSLTPAAASSRLLCSSCLRGDALAILETKDSTANYHHDGVPPDAFAPGTRLGDAFAVLSTNVDRRGRAFASTIEARGGAPVWGVQWHPERPQFDWTQGTGGTYPYHDADSIAAMFAVSTWLVGMAGRNSRQFPDAASEAAALIYNWQPVGSDSYQAYFFTSNLTHSGPAELQRGRETTLVV